MGLVRGRYFDARDAGTAAPVAVVNEAFVRRFFANGSDPIDRYFGLNMPEYASTFRIVAWCAMRASPASSSIGRRADVLLRWPRRPLRQPDDDAGRDSSHFIRGIMWSPTADLDLEPL